MGFFQPALLTATFLCSLVAGFLFAFAVVVMPAIRSLSDKDFIRTFQRIDGIIQNNDPLFILVWVGSTVALVVSVVLGLGRLDGVGRGLLVVAALIYILGVQLPTITINIPLNNKIQKVDVDAASEAEHRKVREAFESRWNRWNIMRTCLSCVVSAILMIVLLRL